MIKKTYSCDGGSICIGTKEARVCIPNNFGDGVHTVGVCEKDRGRYNEDHGWEFKGSVQGQNIKVFSYDCFTDEECEDKENVLFSLCGRFGIFVKFGDVRLERWD